MQKPNNAKRGFLFVNEGLIHGIIPQRGTKQSAGYDLCSVEEHTIEPGQRQLVKTGLTVYMLPDEELQIRPRSGLALKKGITVLNSPGTIDSDYFPNEIGVILINHGDEPFKVNIGDRICQAVFSKYFITDNDQASQERTGGFGHTGV